MVAQPIPVAPGVFRADHEEPALELSLAEKIQPATDSLSVTTEAGRATETTAARRATMVDIPVQCLLVVEYGSEKTSLTLPLRTIPIAPNVYDIKTPGTVRGLKLAMRVSASGQGSLQLQTDYTGLEVGRAQSYARFVDALKREAGKFTVSAYVDGKPRHLVTINLPLPFEASDRERSRQELRFWEAVYEISRQTDTKLVCPAEITDVDLKNLNVVLGAVRNGWIAEQVKDFTIPPTEETAENLLRVVEQEGGMLRALALVTEHETYEIFGVGIDLGQCIRHIAKARLLTPLDDIRRWIESDAGQREPLVTRWEPVDRTPLHILFPEWPKPSSDELRKDLESFENEYRMDTDEFRRAWEAEESEARAIEDGDIWFTLSDIERNLAKQS